MPVRDVGKGVARPCPGSAARPRVPLRQLSITPTALANLDPYCPRGKLVGQPGRELSRAPSMISANFAQGGLVWAALDPERKAMPADSWHPSPQSDDDGGPGGSARCLAPKRPIRQKACGEPMDLSS